MTLKKKKSTLAVMWRIDWGEHERKQEIRRREVMVDWCRARSIEK